jgi:hypothetical protein
VLDASQMSAMAGVIERALRNDGASAQREADLSRQQAELDAYRSYLMAFQHALTINMSANAAAAADLLANL